MEEDVQDLNIVFSDATINEALCWRSLTEKLMNEDIKLKEWMLETELGITNGLEESIGIMQFWHNGEAILKYYQSGFMDEIVPVDAIFLRDFMIEHGWDFVLSEELVEGGRDYWDKFFSIVEEDDTEYEDDSNDGWDFYDEDENFLDYAQRMKEYKKPTANKYNMLDSVEFANHGYDLKRRSDQEENTKF